MGSLTSLPVELLFMVIDEAQRDGSLKSLRCVNKLLCSLVEPMLFHTIIFDSRSPKLDSSLEMLNVLSGSDHQHRPISSHVQSLVIRCFDRLFSPTALLSGKRGDNSGIFRMWKPEDVQQEFDARLLKALGSLKKLKSVQVFSGFDSLSPSSIWSSLLTHHISLNHLTVWARIERSLLNYLNSYSGIQELKIHRAWVSSDPAVDLELAEFFVRTVLPKHRKTLRELTVTAAEEGPWAIGRWNVEWYEACEALRRLEVSVNSEEIVAGDDPVSATLSIARRLCSLRLISFCTADSRRWGSSAGWLSQQHEPHTISLIVRRVTGFEIPECSKTYFPEVEVDGQIYQPSESDNGIRYSPTMSEEAAKIRRWKQQKELFIL